MPKLEYKEMSKNNGLSCKSQEFADLYEKYWDGLLDPVTESRIHQHVLECEQCRKDWEIRHNLENTAPEYWAIAMGSDPSDNTKSSSKT